MKTNADKPNTPKMLNISRVADFLFEAGMLRKTPRTGYQFLGSGGENVAEHSFRTAMIGYVLATMAGADTGHTVMLCLMHDFHEARTGDFNYVNSLYNTSAQRRAMEDAVAGTGLESQLLPLWDEQDKAESREALLAKDADQVDLIANLVEQKKLGNPYADKWLQAAMERLKTVEAKILAKNIEATDPADWWFARQNPEWWIHRHGK